MLEISVIVVYSLQYLYYWVEFSLAMHLLQSNHRLFDYFILATSNCDS